MSWKDLDLGNRTVKELAALQKRIETARERVKGKSKAALLKRWRSEAKKAGFSVEEVVGAAAGKAAPKKRARKSAKKGSKVPMKYRNPKNASEAWSGRGRTPRWMQALIDTGKKKEDFLI